MAGLVADNFRARIDGKHEVSLNVAEHPSQPGDYILSFNPPEALRDGKRHRIDVWVRPSAKNKWRELRGYNWRAVFEKPTTTQSN